MKSPIHILHLEDDPADGELVEATLRAGGIVSTITRVAGRAGFVEALARERFDLVLTDFTLPAFDGISAISIAHATQPNLPVILVSGTLGEELAIDAMQHGAMDYVLKERLARLVPAVSRALRDAEARAERGRLEREVIEAQKMEVVGHLAGGVAHDFNNVLAVIIGYIELIAGKLGQDSPLRKYADEVRHAAERAAGLARQLLVFSRKQTVQPVELDLNAALKDIDGLLRRVIDENVEMVLIAGKDLGLVTADSGYVGQVMMNLVVNARDAMPNGGKIVIETSNVSVEEAGPSAPAGAAPAGYVRVRVTDTGFGMTEEVKARLFEPFFTTKPEGKGTGLGLPTCKTIVQQCRGFITVESELGSGTTICIHFPRVERPRDAAPAARPLPKPMGGTETLLVVEDEPAVRSLAREVLQAQGYEVLTATNGRDGLHVVREHKGGPIELVVTDVVMPLMGGRVMAEWLRTENPGLKVLYTSGYTDDAILKDGVAEVGVGFLPKPYAATTLLRKVRELLDERSRQRIA